MTQSNDTVWVGIDWADRKHRWAMYIEGETGIQQGELLHTPEAVDSFIAGLAVRFPGRRIAVGLEQSRGALIFMLGKYEHLMLVWSKYANSLERLSLWPADLNLSAHRHCEAVNNVTPA